MNFDYASSLERKKIKSYRIVENLLNDWSSALTEAERSELTQFIQEADTMQIRMEGYPEGYYTGTRWFYNNDNLIVKSDDFHFFISMASVRCDGIESAHTMATKYNFFTCDGLTLLQRKGYEAKQALGGIDLTAMPGITAREGQERLEPIMNDVRNF